jgi:hypothetical protein
MCYAFLHANASSPALFITFCIRHSHVLKWLKWKVIKARKLYILRTALEISTCNFRSRTYESRKDTHGHEMRYWVNEWLLTCKRWNKLKRENTSKVYVSWDIPEKVLTVAWLCLLFLTAYNFFHILWISPIWLLISIEIRVLKSSCCHQTLRSPQSISSSQENKMDGGWVGWRASTH